MKTPAPKTTPAAVAPKQKRSQITLDKILAATEKLLEDADFEEITMEQIAKTAGVAVGTVYTRFANKHDLLPYLIGRLQDEQLKLAANLDAVVDCENHSLVDLIKFQIKGSADQMNSKRKGLLKALVRRFLIEGHKIPEEEVKKSQQLQAYLQNWFLQCRDEIEHPDPEQAVKMAVYLMSSPLQIKLFFSTHRTETLSNDEFVEELTRAVVGYLKPSAIQDKRGN